MLTMENNEKQEMLNDLDNVRDYIDGAIFYLNERNDKEMAIQNFNSAKETLRDLKKSIESHAKPPLQILLEPTEKIANTPNMPRRIVDWADETYRKLTDQEQTVRVDDSLVLNEIAKDFERGLCILDHHLASKKTKGE
jgi:uncharacterized protein (UPF0147 family)